MLNVKHVKTFYFDCNKRMFVVHMSSTAVVTIYVSGFEDLFLLLTYLAYAYIVLNYFTLHKNKY